MKMKKVLAMLLAVLMIVTATVAGTVAWLMDTTDEVENTFSTSDIGVKLEETKNNFQMIPGHTIEKDPKAKITSGSEDALLFIKVVENGGNVTVDGVTYDFDDFIEYEINTQVWTALGDAYPGVYYMKVDSDEEKNVEYSILAAGEYEYDGEKYNWDANHVFTKPGVTKEMMNTFDVDEDGILSDGEKEALPTLTFTAYAHQLYRTNGTEFNVVEAWGNLNP